MFNFCLFSASSTEKPSVGQRIVDAVKSYIYTPEDGKSVSSVSLLVPLISILYVFLRFVYFPFVQFSVFL